MLSIGDTVYVCVSHVCPSLFDPVSVLKWRIFLFCDYRTPTPLSVLILMLSGRYSNVCSPLDPSVNSTWTTNIHYMCFPLYYEFFLDWNAAPSCTVVHESAVLRPSFSYMYMLLLILPSVFSLGLPCFSSSGRSFFSLCLYYRNQRETMEMIE